MTNNQEDLSKNNAFSTDFVFRSEESQTFWLFTDPSTGKSSTKKNSYTNKEKDGNLLG
jgi:regulatory protein YycH of two-component signal transduction system YycFG